MKKIQTFINYVGSSRIRQKRNIMFTIVLAVLVLFVVSILMTKPADSMSGKLICGTEIHQHSDSCRRLICPYDQFSAYDTADVPEVIPEITEAYAENGAELLSEAAFEATDAVTEFIAPETAEPHVHGDECYELICGLEEHEHSQECYEQEETMIISNLIDGAIELMADEETAENTENTEDTGNTQNPQVTDVAAVTEEAVTSEVSEFEYFEKVPTTLPVVVLDVKPYVVNSSDHPSKITPQEGSYDDNRPAKIVLSFSLDKTHIQQIVGSGTRNDKNFNNFLVYKLPPGVKFASETAGTNCDAYDTSNGVSKLSSYYTFSNSINGESYIIFRVTDDYICNEFLENDSDNTVKATVFNCKVEFDAVVSRDSSTNKGTREVNLGGQHKTQYVEFNTYAATMHKDGHYKTDSNGLNPYAEWNITVNNKAPQTKLTNGYYIYDDMLVNMKAGSFTVVPAGAAEVVDYTKPDGTASKKIIFKQEASEENNYDIKITYHTDISKDQFYINDDKLRNITNTAYMTDDTLDEPLKDDATVNVPLIVSVYKYSSGKDYQQATNPEVSNQRYWGIDVGTVLNEPLGGYGVYDANFPTSKDKITVTKNSYPYEVIPADKYTFENNTITFADDFTETAVKINYKYSKDLMQNTAKAVYPPETDKDGPSSTATIYDTYKPYELKKSGKVEDGSEVWTIEVNQYDSNKAPIYGMEIHDEKFADISKTGGVDDITVTATTDGWNATGNIDFDWSADRKTITLKKLAGSGDPDAKSVKIVFKATIDPNSENGKKIAAAQAATFTNKFDIDMNDYVDEFETSFTYDPANIVTKKLVSPSVANNHVESWKSDDGFKTKELTWQVDMQQGAGFTGATKVFVDVIQAKDSLTGAESDQAKHYIAPGQRGILTSGMDQSQLKNIIIKAKVKSTDQWVEITNTADKTFYTIDFFTDTQALVPASDSDNAKSFKITFDDTNFVSANGSRYEFVTMTYSTTIDMTNVTDPAMISFNNEAKFNNKTSSSGYKVEVYDPDDPPFTKTLVDPVSYEEITEETLNLSDVKKIIEDGVSYYIFAWKIDIDEYAWKSSQYSFKDVFDKNNHGFSLCTSGAYLPKMVRFYQSGDVYEDMSPTDGENWNSYKYTAGNNYAEFTAVSEVKKFVYFTKIPVSEFKPKVLEKVDAGETYLLENSATEYKTQKYPDAISDSIMLTGEHDPILPDSGDIDKVYDITKDPKYQGNETSGKGNNTIEYAIDINSGALDLSNSDHVILNDLFSTKSYEIKDEYGNTVATKTGDSLVNTVLENVMVYEVNPDGTKTLLPESEYSYQYNEAAVEYYPVEVDSMSFDNYGADRGYNLFWLFGTVNNALGNSIQEGDVITVTMKYDNPNHRICDGNQKFVMENGQTHYEDPSIKFVFTNTQYGADHEIVINNPDAITFDENGYATYTVTAPAGYTALRVQNKTHGFEEVTATVQRKSTSAELGLVLPDAKHLRIEYAYTLLDPDTGSRPTGGSKLVFSNTASLIANGTISDSTQDTTLEFLYQAAETSVAYKPRINKLDVADQTIKLDASFYLGKYTADGWKWYNQSLNSDGEVSLDAWGDEESAQKITTVNGEFKFGGLEQGVVYVLKETDAPVTDKYVYEEASKVKPYYFTYVKKPASYPAEGINSGEAFSSSNVKLIRSGSVIPVTNNRIISVNVNKRWTDSSMNDAEITAKLYWSYTKALHGFPDEMTEATPQSLGVPVETVVHFKGSYSWQGLPNGINGKPIYYYVVERGYTINGVSYKVSDEIQENLTVGEYLPFYTGNGVNSSEQTIEITNANALRVEKLWHDNQNNPLPSHYLPDSIEFKLFARQKEGDKETLIQNDGSETFTITAENNWSCDVSPELIKNYNYFRVEEVNPLDGYAVSYNSNYQGPTGVITVINKNTEVENPTTQIIVEKTWYDGGDKDRPETLNITLMSSKDSVTWTNVQNPNVTLSYNNDKSVWSYTYSDLPYRDSDGSILYYKVEEDVPNGYVCSYSSNNDDGIDSGTIKITNTKVIDLTINKQWSDIDRRDHNDSTVIATVYRSVNQSDITKKNDSAFIFGDPIEIKKSHNWTRTVSNLEAYDADGKPYYYWVVENEADFKDVYTASYTYSGSRDDAVVGEDGIVTINNEYIYPPAELPSTGGHGTIIYYILGAVIGLTGLALFINLRQYTVRKH